MIFFPACGILGAMIRHWPSTTPRTPLLGIVDHHAEKHWDESTKNNHALIWRVFYCKAGWSRVGNRKLDALMLFNGLIRSPSRLSGATEKRCRNGKEHGENAKRVEERRGEEGRWTMQALLQLHDVPLAWSFEVC